MLYGCNFRLTVISLVSFLKLNLVEDRVIITKVINLYHRLFTNKNHKVVDNQTYIAPSVGAVRPPKSGVLKNKTQSDLKSSMKPPKNAIPREDHNISRKLISPNAIRVLHRLHDRGYQAYLVGGCIRDILMGRQPKDFDVVTNATPEQVKVCFNNCRLIGKRFRLAHIMYGREIIEVATFRGHHQSAHIPDKSQKTANYQHAQQSTEGQLLRDNVYGSIEEDAQRRDFTINALYYTIKGFYIRDFVNGMEAIKARRIQLIGDPESRYREDPVRMLRAIRFATKLDMTIEPNTEQPIFQLGNLLTNIPPARLFEESMKLILAGKAAANYRMMRKYDLFRHLFPVPYEVLEQHPDSAAERLVEQVFVKTDQRINTNKRVTPAYIHAALLWYVVEKETNIHINTSLTYYDASHLAMNDVLSRHCRSIALPKRFSNVARDIWQLQYRLTRRHGKRPFRLLEHPKFRAGYDFLLLRGEIEGGKIAELAQWWTEFQYASEDTRQRMSKALKQHTNTHNISPLASSEDDDPEDNFPTEQAKSDQPRRGPRKRYRQATGRRRQRSPNHNNHTEQRQVEQQGNKS